MKIVLINTFDIFGGAARSMWRLHKGLRAIGVESTVLCLRKSSKDEFTEALALDSSVQAERARGEWGAIQQTVNANLAKQHCTFFSLPVPGYDLSSHTMVRDADVIHLHWVAGMLSPESVATLLALGKPVVWTLHDMRAFTGGCHFSDGCRRFEADCAECPQLKPGFNHLAEFNLKNLATAVDASSIKVVTPSGWLGECARASRFFGNSRVEIIPYGLETDIFRKIDKAAALETLGLEAGPMSFLFGADNIMEPRKGVQTLVQALQICARDSKFSAAIQAGKVRFLSFGLNGAPFGNLPWVKNLGRVSGDEKMASAYSAADVFLCPTLEDNLPNTILESMACGTPAIASNVGGVPDMITEGKDGWMFEAGDAKGLAKRILEALQKRENMAALGLAARKTIEERFGLKLQAKRYLELYEVLAPKRGAAAPLESKTAPEAVVMSKPQDSWNGDFFSPEEVTNIKFLAEAFQKNPLEKETGEALRNLRLGLAEHLLGVEEGGLQELFANDYGVVFGLIIGSGLLDSDRLPEEDKIAEVARLYFQKLGEKAPDLRFHFVAMLFFRAHEIERWPALNAVPEWMEERYFELLFHVPDIFFRKGEAEEYLIHMRAQYSALRGLLTKQPTSRFARKFLPKFLNKCNVIPLYFNEDPLKDIMEIRAELSALALRSKGAGLDYKFPKRGGGEAKIRVGILDAAVAPRSETYVTLPALRLDRKKFSVQLLSLSRALSPELESACRRMVDGVTILPGEVVKQVQAIRRLDLDVLLFGSNTCAVSNGQFLLSLHRLARLQLVSYCSPVTTGNKNIDAFLSGTLACVPEAQEQFTERLIQIPGPPGCMDYTHDRKPAVRGFTKADFDVPEDAVLFVSGANCFKILPEIQEVWADILEQVPGSRLLLHPFNPNWTKKYPEVRFQESFFKMLARRGIDLDRLIVSTHKLPTRSDVVAMMAIGDVYLDTFPYSGSISLTDPLETGVPTLVCEDESLRSRQGAALLRDLGLDDLITTSKSTYILKAIELAQNPSLRQEIRKKILKGISAQPRFLDPERYARNLGHMLETVVSDGFDAWTPQEAEILTLSSELSPVQGKGFFTPNMASISDAQIAFAEGRLSDAEDICRDILSKDERCAEAWRLMGQMAALQADLDTAGEFLSVACELDSQNAEFIRDLAEVFLRKKELETAEQHARRALELSTDSPEGLVLIGRILAEKDDKSTALEAFQEAIRIRKDYAEGLSYYALALQKFGRGKDAISQIRKACALEPESVEFQTNLAILLEQNARYVDALAAYGKAARMNPDVGFVWFRQGKLLNGLKRYAESVTTLEKAIALPGQLGDYHYEYGLALHMSKRFQEALVHYEKALSMGYNTSALQCNRGVIYKDLRRGGDAILAFHTAVKMEPTNVSYLNNLGAAALEIGLNSEALECFEQAVEKNPKLPTAHNNIGNLLKDRARGMDALPHYRTSIELNPDDRDAPSNYLLCHMYIPDMDPKIVFEEHKKWGLATTKKFPQAFKFKPREAGSKIRVGFLSADLCHHPVAHFIEPIFREYDRERFEFVAYGDQRKSDDFSARFAKQVDLWRETSSYDDRALAKLIHEDRVDILFELAGHTAYNRLGVFALKPAPVQISYLGYPGTTGLPTIDFRITDPFVDPLGKTEHLHTEKLIRLPECAWCFEPDAFAPEVEPLPALKNGYVTFGCFNNMAKLNAGLFETWAEILLRVSGSHLRLKARTLTDEGVRKELMAYFTGRGIDESRLDFFGHTKKIVDHLSHYHSVDIALDSFPYHGTTTTCEAMWMGCPVVTRAGKVHVSRVGVSLLNAVHLQEFIAETQEDYIEKAVELASDLDKIASLRSELRKKMKSSVLMDGKSFVRGFEAALTDILPKPRG